MSNLHLRNLTNSFQAVRLNSLASWKSAVEFSPRDRGGPYIITQEGYDPEDPTVQANEFVLGRSGRWLALAHFFRLPVPERRAEFIFGTAAEVMQMMSELPSKAVILRPGTEATDVPPPENDEMATAIKAGRAS